MEEYVKDIVGFGEEEDDNEVDVFSKWQQLCDLVSLEEDSEFYPNDPKIIRERFADLNANYFTFQSWTHFIRELKDGKQKDLQRYVLDVLGMKVRVELDPEKRAELVRERSEEKDLPHPLYPRQRKWTVRHLGTLYRDAVNGEWDKIQELKDKKDNKKKKKKKKKKKSTIKSRLSSSSSSSSGKKIQRKRIKLKKRKRSHEEEDDDDDDIIL